MRSRYLCTISCLLLAWVACSLIFRGRVPPPDAADGQEICVVGTVYRQEQKQSGQRIYLKDISIASPSAGVLPETENGSWERQRILAYLTEARDVRLGSHVMVRGTCQFPERARNPGAFDARAYYGGLGISLFLKKASILQSDHSVYLVRDAISRFQAACRARLLAIADAEDAGILSAMLLGDRGILPEETKDLYQDAGIIHLLAVSGLHISLTGMMLYRALRKMGCSFVSCAAVSGGVMAAYCYMTGSVSAVRAVVMFGFFLLSQVTGRTGDLPTSLAVAGAAIALANHAQLTQAGFLLSFGAVCGVLLSSAWKSRVLRASPLGVNLGVQLTTLPLTAYFYFQFPLYAVAVNLCVVWMTSFILGFGIAGLLASFAHPGLGQFFLAPAHYLLGAVAWICDWSRRLPMATLVTGKPALWRMVAYFALLALLVFWKNRYGARICKRAAVADLAMLILSGLLLAGLFHRPDRSFRMTCLDVGQGDGICIQNEAGSVWLFDVGSSSEKELAAYCLEPFLRSEGIRKVDAWALSHADLDHVSALLEVLRSYERGMDGANIAGVSIGKILLPEGEFVDASEEMQQAMLLAKAHGIEVVRVRKGTTVKDGRLAITFLAPDPAVSYEDANAACAVAQVSYGSFRALLAGDVQGKGEEALVRSGALADVDVLKVAHHGSKGSTSAAFLAQVRPEVSVISCGRDNRYGHPHAELIARLNDAKSKIVRTDIGGAVQIRVTKKGYAVNILIDEKSDKGL